MKTKAANRKKINREWKSNTSYDEDANTSAYRKVTKPRDEDVDAFEKKNVVLLQNENRPRVGWFCKSKAATNIVGVNEFQGL